MADTLEIIIKRITDAADVDLEDVPRGAKLVWNPPMPGAAPLTWEVGQKAPHNPALVVLALFKGDGEWRAYCLAALVEGAKPETVQPPTVYTLTSMGQFVETMLLPVWERLVTSELVELAGQAGPGEEPVECVSCGELIDIDDTFCSECGSKQPTEPEAKEPKADTVPAQASAPNGPTA